MRMPRTNCFRAYVLLSCLLSGCFGNPGRFYYHSKHPKQLAYYKDHATAVEFPTEDFAVQNVGLTTEEPRRLRRLTQDSVRDLTLQEAIHIGLMNNRIIRDAGQFRSPGNTILNNPNGVPSVYDTAIRESGFLFGARGVEASLSDFDARFVTNMTWGRTEQIQNAPFLQLPAGAAIRDETGSFSSRLEKNFAYGATFAVQHDWDYSAANISSRLFNSAYTGFMRTEYRQPLLAGSGTEFNRIAGPVGDTLRGVSGVSQGVVISRINTDISLTQFEASVADLTKDIEDTYWDLYLTYRTYDAEVTTLRDAKRNVSELKARGEADVSADVLSQAKANYYDSESRVEQSFADLIEAETRLRRLLGMPVNDGNVLRPIDEPVTAEYVADWHIALAEALTRRNELRRQKWNIKSLQLQLQASENLNRPRLDFVAQYQVNGFGDRLLGSDDPDGPATDLGSAYSTMTENKHHDYQYGFQFSVPLGRRLANTQVKNLELQLAKAREVLAVQELEISHELASAFQSLDRWWVSASTNSKRQQETENQVEATDNRIKNSPSNQRTPEAIDLLLRARTAQRDARVAYYRSIVEYNKAVASIHFTKGTILEHNNIHLAEGLWDPMAYNEALRRAWARTYAHGSTLMHAEPMEFVTQDSMSLGFVGSPPPPPAPIAIPADTSEVPTVPPIPDGVTPNDSQLAPYPPAPASDSPGKDTESDTPRLPRPEDREVPQPKRPPLNDNNVTRTNAIKLLPAENNRVIPAAGQRQNGSDSKPTAAPVAKQPMPRTAAAAVRRPAKLAADNPFDDEFADSVPILWGDSNGPDASGPLKKSVQTQSREQLSDKFFGAGLSESSDE